MLRLPSSRNGSSTSETVALSFHGDNAALRCSLSYYGITKHGMAEATRPEEIRIFLERLVSSSSSTYRMRVIVWCIASRQELLCSVVSTVRVLTTNCIGGNCTGMRNAFVFCRCLADNVQYSMFRKVGRRQELLDGCAWSRRRSPLVWVAQYYLLLIYNQVKKMRFF